WAKLREAERYQMKVAQDFYTTQQWKVAMSEYEKFLNLYEKSTGSSYAQLKWAICQQRLRKVNTAIKDGFQNVIDYWPDSPEAISAAYLIGQAYRDMGEVKKAKIAYIRTIQDHPEHAVAAHAREDLYGMARISGDMKE